MLLPKGARAVVVAMTHNSWLCETIVHCGKVAAVVDKS